MCDKKCNKEDFKFYDIAALLEEDDGKPHTVNLCGTPAIGGWQKEAE